MEYEYSYGTKVLDFGKYGRLQMGDPGKNNGVTAVGALSGIATALAWHSDKHHRNALKGISYAMNELQNAESHSKK